MTKDETHRVAIVQMRATRTVDENVALAEHLIRQAARGGACYVLTPENTTLMELERDRVFAQCETEEKNRALKAFCALAKELSLWLHIGAMPVKIDAGKLANRSYLIAPDGSMHARYDKIHMFDVDLPGGESYCESRTYQPGTKAVIADLGWGTLGLTICYDLRFPHLFRGLAQMGAQLISMPAAFTRQTGEAHWHILLRARAIETGCFILAANQGGLHETGRETFGHSLIISPWGEILAEAGLDPGVIFTDLNLREIESARQKIPALKHDRPIEPQEKRAFGLSPIEGQEVNRGKP